MDLASQCTTSFEFSTTSLQPTIPCSLPLPPSLDKLSKYIATHLLPRYLLCTLSSERSGFPSSNPLHPSRLRLTWFLCPWKIPPVPIINLLQRRPTKYRQPFKLHSCGVQSTSRLHLFRSRPVDLLLSMARFGRAYGPGLHSSPKP